MDNTYYIEPNITMYDDDYEDYHHDGGGTEDDNNDAQVRRASPDERQAAPDESFGRLQVSRFVTSSTSLPPFVVADKLKSMPSLSVAFENQPTPLANCHF